MSVYNQGVPVEDVFFNLYNPRNLSDLVLLDQKPLHFSIKKREKGFEFRLNRTAIRWIPKKEGKDIVYTYKWVSEEKNSLENLRNLFQKYTPIELPEECGSF